MKKRLSTLICVMLFLCQNSLYVTAEAASAILTENKKTTKEQEISSENDEEQDVLWIPAVYQGINTEFGTYYAYETNLIFEMSDEEKNLLQTYFEANMSLLGTSQKLFLHKNTVQYKLNHIYQKCRLNPRVFKDAVLLYLALQL